MTPLSGGCQCGAVRYVLLEEPADPHICHCRMCQKAAGNYFMPLAKVGKQAFTLTRGTVAWFHSSDPVRRGFCRDCGTPLVFETVAAPQLYITLGALDDPAAITPAKQYGLEAKMPWLAALETLPGAKTEDETELDGIPIEDIRATNHQHPDHDTDRWPPEGTGQ